MTEAYGFLATVADQLRRLMPNLPMRFAYRRGEVAGVDEATSLVLERSDGRRFRVTVRELTPQDPAQAEAATRVVHCANCSSDRSPVLGGGPAQMLICPECDWPVGVPVPEGDLCSICRRRHGREVEHACE